MSRPRAGRTACRRPKSRKRSSSCRQSSVRRRRPKKHGTYCPSATAHHSMLNLLHIRRREITLERKKAAEERRRLEEDKAKARTADFNHSHPSDVYPNRWAHERLHVSAAGLAGPRRSTTETLWYCGTGGIHVSVAFISFGMTIPNISPHIVTISGCVWNPSGLETHIRQLEHATCPSRHRFKKLYKLACWSIFPDHDLGIAYVRLARLHCT